MADVMTRYQQAVQHRLVGEYDQAIELLQGVLAEMPNFADAHHEMGLIYSFKVFIDESIFHLEKAIELAPNTIKYLVDLGKTHTMYGDYDKAIPVFERVLSMDPFNDEANKNLALIR